MYAARYDLGFDSALDVHYRPDLQPVLFWKYGDISSDYNRNRQLGAAFVQDTPLRNAAVGASFGSQQPAILVPLVRAGAGLVLITRDAALTGELAAAGLTVAELATVRIVQSL